MGMNLSTPSKLEKLHLLEEFDCGLTILNNWLRRYAMINQQAHAANTYVTSVDNRVVGFYTLAVGGFEYRMATLRVRKGLARHPIPVMILARLAVDRSYQGRKIGKGLLRDAILRTMSAAEIAGIRALFVHAKNEKARNFYKKFDFEPSSVDTLKLMLRIKDAKKTVGIRF